MARDGRRQVSRAHDAGRSVWHVNVERLAWFIRRLTAPDAYAIGAVLLNGALTFEMAPVWAALPNFFLIILSSLCYCRSVSYAGNLHVK